MGSGGELGSARRRLSDAYDRARAVGYRPGSDQMRELAAAEQAYRQARLRDDRARAGGPDLPATDLDLTTTSGTRPDALEVEIDLRDAGEGRYRQAGEVASRPQNDDTPPRPEGC